MQGSSPFASFSSFPGLEPVCWAYQGSLRALLWPAGLWQQWSESPAGPSQPPTYPGPCSEDKAELILSGKVRLVSWAGWIQGDETNALGWLESRALATSPAGSTQHSPQKDHAGSIHPVLRRLASGTEAPGRRQEEAGACKPRAL